MEMRQGQLHTGSIVLKMKVLLEWLTRNVLADHVVCMITRWQNLSSCCVANRVSMVFKAFGTAKRFRRLLNNAGGFFLVYDNVNVFFDVLAFVSGSHAQK